MAKKFKQGTRRKAIEYEKDWVKKWKENKTFEKSIEQRPTENGYVFYDGPPFITGQPHAGTLISSIVKDAVPRYWTMKGKRVERRWGWDCHGLPAEVYTEKTLGIKGKEEVLKYGLERYIVAARDNMVQTGSEWEDTVDRVGRWVDFQGAYKTMDKEYMESVWWAFKELYGKGKIYEGEKVLMYCTQDATPLSKNEVTMDKGAYQDVTDPSVYVKFRLKYYDLRIAGEQSHELYDSSDPDDFRDNMDNQKIVTDIMSKNQDKPVYMLAWTTTPWTLLSNTALAVNENETYSLIFLNDQFFIVAAGKEDSVFGKDSGYVVVRKRVEGSSLVGAHYEPLFTDRGDEAHKVWHADYVSTDAESDDTGIVHLAPAYGEEDFELALAEGFPTVHTINDNGVFTEGPWEGEYVWDINKQIAKDMHRYSTKTLMGDYSDMTVEQRIEFHKTTEPEPDVAIWKVEYIKHSYPHCHRCGTKLMYRAHPSWFMDIIGQKEDMFAQNSNINWFPEHLKDGRFAKTIESAPDWNLSRDRFWATPMPVWEGVDADGNKLQKVVGSYAELKELSGLELEDYHRPWVDDITFEIDGVRYTRVEKVMDCWFESGSMPFAQFHYPFENKQKFEDNFPGDFIVEYIGQVRAWFYYMHAVSVGLFGVNSFKNVVVTGNLMGNDGFKLSKSRGNFTDPNEAMDTYSSDAYRFVMLSSNLLNGEDYVLLDKNINDVNRKLSMIWNMYDFFTLYADVDGWQWSGKLEDPYSDVTNTLDKWVLSRLHQTMQQVDENMEKYDIPGATRPMLQFVDDASNWYVRRSRKRFWKSENDGDKNDAYRTLHYVLVQTAKMFAPFTPFLAEELYTLLTGEESVHLTDWSEFGHIDEMLVEQMESTRQSITEGLSQRAKHQIKVRQPLKGVSISKIPEEMVNIVKEELNVKEVYFHKTDDDTVLLDTNITAALAQEGLMREVVRVVQAARKKADLQVDDRIKLSLTTKDKDLKAAIEEFGDEIQKETLANELVSGKDFGYKAEQSVGKAEIVVSLEKS